MPKLLLLCNPCNPNGVIYSEDTLKMCIQWAACHDIHIICDEIYGNSTYTFAEGFSSIAKVCRDLNPTVELYMGNNVHVAYGFSKDFGLSGMRVGVLFTHNKTLLSAVENLSYFQAVSNDTQFLLTKVLQDKEFVQEFVSENRRRLTAAYHGLEDAMAAIGVPLTPAQGSLMAWADFRRYLKEDTWDAEQELWMELFESSRVLFTTGSSCQSEVPGFFRICFAWPAASEEDPAIAMKELKKRLVAKFGPAK